jgi:phosphoserine phosphatase
LNYPVCNRSNGIEVNLNPALNVPKKWTARQFERLVLDGNPKSAIFDCDGTLWSGDAGAGFMNWSIQQGICSRATCDWIEARYRDYQDGKVGELAICGDMVLIYAGLNEQDLRSAAARYVEEYVRPRFFAEMVSLVSTLGRNGVELWAVSSTNRWVIAEGVRNLGIPEDRILAAGLHVSEGILSNEILDVPTDDGKAVALRRVGLDRPDAVFGNSIHDLAMLKMARCAYPVNPSPALLEAASTQGWGYFCPQAAEGIETAVGGELFSHGFGNRISAISPHS